MTDRPIQDPFSEALDVIIEAMYEVPGLVNLGNGGLVLEANIIRFDKGLSDDRPDTITAQDADTPQLRIVPAGGAGRHISSSAFGGTQVFQVQLISLNMNIRREYLRVKWMLWCWLCRLDDIQDRLPFVVNATIADMLDSFVENDAEVDSSAWVGVASIELDLSFDRTRMRSGVWR